MQPWVRLYCPGLVGGSLRCLNDRRWWVRETMFYDALQEDYCCPWRLLCFTACSRISLLYGDNYQWMVFETTVVQLELF